MLVRLFAIVLALVGPLPFRVCTCAAAAPSNQALFISKPDVDCGCKHHSSSGTLSDADDSVVTGLTEISSDTQPIPDRHHEDCPALNPRPVDPPAVQAPVEENTANVGLSAFVCVDPAIIERPCISHCSHNRPIGTDIPLYLSLLSIRI